MASCVAVIGKENSPLYIACSNPEQVSIGITLPRKFPFQSRVIKAVPKSTRWIE